MLCDDMVRAPPLNKAMNQMKYFLGFVWYIGSCLIRMFLFGIQFDLELHTNLCQYVMQNLAAKNNVIDITFTLAERCI